MKYLVKQESGDPPIVLNYLFVDIITQPMLHRTDITAANAATNTLNVSKLGEKKVRVKVSEGK